MAKLFGINTTLPKNHLPRLLPFTHNACQKTYFLLRCPDKISNIENEYTLLLLNASKKDNFYIDSKQASDPTSQ